MDLFSSTNATFNIYHLQCTLSIYKEPKACYNNKQQHYKESQLVMKNGWQFGMGEATILAVADSLRVEIQKNW